MPVQADETYEAVVFSAAYTYNEKADRSDLFMNYRTGEGMVNTTWYVTENTIDRLKENLTKCFSVSDAQFEDVEFLRTGLLKWITGKNCSIVTEYKKDNSGNIYKDKNGKQYVTVKWMNASRGGRPATPESITKMAGIFGAVVSRPRGNSAGGGLEPPEQDWNGQQGISDDDVPF